MEHENIQIEDLPQTLIDELKVAEKKVPLITASVDRRISDAAKEQFKRRRQPPWKSRPAWVAIAATLLIAVMVVQFGGINTAPLETIYADVDGSGQIDIADVLALARTRDPEQITQAELDEFAMRIVSLSSGGDAS